MSKLETDKAKGLVVQESDYMFESCIPTNKEGIPISTVNNAQQINAGLDIINVLCKFHNVTAPIFIDNREGVNDLIETQSQIINLVVSKEDFKVE